jgi:hypothetical protein
MLNLLRQLFTTFNLCVHIIRFVKERTGIYPISKSVDALLHAWLMQENLGRENLENTKLCVFCIWKLLIIKIGICSDIGWFIFVILEWKFSRFTSMTESCIWNERNVIPKSCSGTDPLPFHYTKLMLYRNTRR